MDLNKQRRLSQITLTTSIKVNSGLFCGLHGSRY